MSHPNSIYADSALFRGGSPAITQVGSPAFSAGRNPSLHSVAVNLHQLPLTPVPPRKALADVCSVFVSAGGDARECCGRAATELCADVAVVSDWTPLGLSPAGPRSLSELAGPCGPTINIFVPNSFPSATEPRAVQLTVCIGPLRIQLRSPRGCSHSRPRPPAGSCAAAALSFFERRRQRERLHLRAGREAAVVRGEPQDRMRNLFRPRNPLKHRRRCKTARRPDAPSAEQTEQWQSTGDGGAAPHVFSKASTSMPMSRLRFS